MRSLGSKLWLATTLVALLGVVLVAVIITATVTRQVTVLARQGMRSRAVAAAPVLAEHYAARGSWQDVQATVQELLPLLAGMQGPGRGQGAEHGESVRLLLVDPQWRVLFDSGGSLEGRTIATPDRDQGVAITSGGAIVGIVIVTTSDLSGVSESEAQFLAALRRGVIYGSAAVILIALLASALLSRQLTAPLQRLTRAAEGMTGGQRWSRVDVRSQDEIGELARALNAMAAEIEAGEAQRRQMTADIAHELRNPLTVIRGNLEALIDGVYPTDASHLATVYDETLLLQRLVEDLRVISLAESGHLSLHRENVDVRSLLQAQVESLRPAAAARGVELCVEVEEELALSADPLRLRQILGNLLSNALRYTPAGGSITLAAKRTKGERVQLWVADTGHGIPAENLPRLFERLYRPDEGRSREEGGTGLGLAIVRALVEAHGGTIAVQSELGRGTTFTIEL